MRCRRFVLVIWFSGIDRDGFGVVALRGLLYGSTDRLCS